MISDAWFQTSSSGGIRIFMKQSPTEGGGEYLLFCFFSLSHYCQGYPKKIITKLNGKTYHSLSFNTRTLHCFKE